MDSEQQNFENPNFLENLIRQKQLMNGPLGGGLPQAMPENSQPNSQPSPDLTVHHLHGTLDNSVTPQAQNAINPQASPVPKIGPIDPNSVNPAESAYKQAIMNEPMHSDYHPSVMRKIGGTLAGIGAGILGGGVEGGIKVGDQVRDAPYNSQHNNWQQFAKNRGVLATEEIAGNEAAGKSALTQAQTDEQNSLGKLHTKQANIIAPDMATDVQNKVTEAQGHLKVDTREAKMLDGTIKHLVQRNGLFYDPETATTTNPNGVRIDRAAIEDISDEGKSLRETKQSRIPGNLGASIKAKQIISAGVGGKTEDGEKIDQPTFEAAKQFDEALSAGKEPAGAFARIIKDRNSEREAAGKPKMTSAEEEALQIKLLTTQKPPQALMVTPDNQAIRVVPGSKIPEGSQTPSGVSQVNTPTSATRARGEAAQTAIASGNDVIKFATENKANLGHLGDYWSNIVQNTPAADPKVEEFRGRVASWAAQQAAAHGFRAATIMHEFESRVGPTKNVDAIISAINGINDELQYAVDTGHGKTPGSNSLPGGTTIDEVKKEMQRRGIK